MAFITKSFLTKQIFNLSRVLNASQVRQRHWFPYFKPGPYPKTEKERIEAAKKYNLLPEEYEPYPEGADGCGDYPKLPFDSVDSKNPYYPFTDGELRRNFNEPIHREMVILLPECLSTGHERPTKKEALISFCTVMSALLLFYYCINSFELREPVAEKQFIGSGPHYLFEVDEGKKH